MKNIYLLVTLFTVIEFNIHCQGWKYESGESASGGKFSLASVVGKGYQFPNTEPLFAISRFENGEVNIYVTKVGCACCDNLYAIIKFDKSNKPYLYKVTTNSRKDSWYIRWNNFGELKELLNNINSHATMNVRLRSDCGQNDFDFVLSGSSAPVNDVTAEYLVYLEELEKEKARLAKLAEEERQRKERLLVSEGLKIACITGDSLKGDSLTYVFYWLKSPVDSVESVNPVLTVDSVLSVDYVLPTDSVPSVKFVPPPASELKFYVINNDSLQLQENEKILFSDCSDSTDFCILHKAISYEFYDSDTIFFIYKKAIDINTIEEIE